MTVLAPKRSTETISYTLDIRRELGIDAIETYTLVVASGTVTVPTEQQQNVGFAVICNIAGGVDGVTQALTLTATTVGSQVIVKNYTILINDTASAVYPSTSTKRFILIQHFAAMGLSPYEFNPEPEEYTQAMDSLDIMMAELAINGLDLGYAFPPTLGGGDLDDVSGIPDFSVNFVALRLAQRVAPFIGKSLSREAMTALTKAEISVRAKVAVLPEYSLPFRTPAGAGAKPWSTWYWTTGALSGSNAPRVN
jgi:hypothetical protein